MGLDAMGDGIKPLFVALVTPPVATPLSAGRVHYHTSLQKDQLSHEIRIIAARGKPRTPATLSLVMMDPQVGLCSVCRHSRIVYSARRSRFFLCELAQVDPAYRKYPPLPMHTCPGFEAAPASLGT